MQNVRDKTGGKEPHDLSCNTIEATKTCVLAINQILVKLCPLLFNKVCHGSE